MSRGIRTFNLTLLVALSLLSIIASGGGSGGDNPGKTSGEYLFYVDANDQLIAVDPNDVSQPITVASNLQAFDSNLGSSKTISIKSAEISGNGSTLRLDNYRQNKILYLQNGMFYQVSASLNSSLTPSQVSNANNVYLCDLQITSANYSEIIYSDAIATDCNNVEYFLIRHTMDETQSPIPLPGELISGFIDQTGILTGYLFYINNQLVHYDHNLNEVANLGAFPAVNFASTSLFNQSILLTETGDFHFYNAATQTLTSSLHTFNGATAENFIAYNLAWSLTALYFVDGNSFYELGYNETKNARLLATEPSTSSIYVSGVYQGKLIYRLISSPAYNVKTINIDNGAIRTLYASTAAFNSSIANADRIYTSYSNDISVTFPLSDPTSVTTTPNSSFAGIQLFNSYNYSRDGYRNAPWSKVLQLNNIDRPTNNSLFGATLSLLDYSTSNLITTLGTIDTQITRLFGFSSSHRFLMLGGYGINGTDIYYVDTSVANSLTQVTFTPDTTESIVY